MSRIVDVEQLGCLAWKDGEHGTTFDDGVLWVLEKIDELPSAQPEKQHGRIFQEIVVEYPSISTYPEYKGKPYFSIKYTENGQEFIGYGTYKPEVLSEYLKEYFMTSAQQETHEKRTETHACDCISREAAIDAICAVCGNDCDKSEFVYNAPQDEQVILCPEHYCLCTLPSAQSERKKGKWIVSHVPDSMLWECNQCGFDCGAHSFNFCPNCGADMRGEDDDIPMEYFESGGIYDKGR